MSKSAEMWDWWFVDLSLARQSLWWSTNKAFVWTSHEDVNLNVFFILLNFRAETSASRRYCCVIQLKAMQPKLHAMGLRLKRRWAYSSDWTLCWVFCIPAASKDFNLVHVSRGQGEERRFRVAGQQAIMDSHRRGRARLMICRKVFQNKVVFGLSFWFEWIVS